MERTIVGIITIVAGFALIIFKEKFIRDSIAYQNKTFGFHFGEKEVNVGRWYVPLAGLVFIIIGTITLLGGFK